MQFFIENFRKGLESLKISLIKNRNDLGIRTSTTKGQLTNLRNYLLRFAIEIAKA